LRKLSTEIGITASPEQVWAVLADLHDYPRWNPFITRIEGELQEGSTLEVTLRPPGRKGMVFRPRLLTVIEGRELKWLGRLFVGGIFDGEHHFWIERMDGGVIFHQDEIFRGVLVPLTGSVLKRTSQGFDLMNHALKAEVEARAASAAKDTPSS
jgi:hypothetical protein